MKKMIGQELDQERRMVVFKNIRFYLPLLFLSLILICYSCNNKSQNEQVLLNSIELSNGIYIDNLTQLRDFFESKFIEEPKKYESIFGKIKQIEDELVMYSKLQTIKEKKTFITDLTIKLKSLSQMDTIEFVCLNIDDNNVTLFDAIAKNDFNRNLYKIYLEFYYYHHAVFLGGEYDLN
jgi:hypothetical protein